jgi:hypothetical protein
VDDGAPVRVAWCACVGTTEQGCAHHLDFCAALPVLLLRVIERGFSAASSLGPLRRLSSLFFSYAECCVSLCVCVRVSLMRVSSTTRKEQG